MQNGFRHMPVDRFGKEMGVTAFQGTNHEIITPKGWVT